MRPTFDHTVSVLVKAYLNGTLELGNCCACAVGNIIADSCDIKFIRSMSSCQEWTWDSVKPKWYKDGVGVFQSEQTEVTGYSVTQLALIEMAFESVWPHRHDAAIFDGLMQVIDVLASIHNVDLTLKEEAKKLFVKV